MLFSAPTMTILTGVIRPLIIHDSSWKRCHSLHVGSWSQSSQKATKHCIYFYRNVNSSFARLLQSPVRLFPAFGEILLLTTEVKDWAAPRLSSWISAEDALAAAAGTPELGVGRVVFGIVKSRMLRQLVERPAENLAGSVDSRPPNCMPTCQDANTKQSSIASSPLH